MGASGARAKQALAVGCLPGSNKFNRHSQKQWMLKTHKRSALVSGRRNRLRVIKRTKPIHSIASCSGNIKQSIPILFLLVSSNDVPLGGQ